MLISNYFSMCKFDFVYFFRASRSYVKRTSILWLQPFVFVRFFNGLQGSRRIKLKQIETWKWSAPLIYGKLFGCRWLPEGKSNSVSEADTNCYQKWGQRRSNFRDPVRIIVHQKSISISAQSLASPPPTVEKSRKSLRPWKSFCWSLIWLPK